MVSAGGVYLLYKPPVVDYMPEAGEVTTGRRLAFTVRDMLALAGEALDPPAELRRPGLSQMQRIRATTLDYLAGLLDHVVRPLGGTVLAVDGEHESLAAAVAGAGGLGRVRLVLGSAISASFPELLRVFRVLLGRGVPCVGGGIHLTARPGDLDRYLRPHLPAGAAAVGAVAGPCDLAVMSQLVADAARARLQPRYSGGANMEDDYWRRFGRPGRGSHHLRCVEVSRGCPYSCPFCSISVLPRDRRRLQVRGADDLLAELRGTWEQDHRLQRRMRFFVAENVYGQRRIFESLLRRMIVECPPISFVAQADCLVALDEPFLRLLRRAGCLNLLIGFESLSEPSLEAISKRSAFTLMRRLGSKSVGEAYAQAVRRIRASGITVTGAFILGLAHDRPGCGRELGEFMAANDLLPHPTALTALPGAELFESTYRRNLVYGHPDDQPDGAGPYPAAFSGMDLTEANVAVPGGLRPEQIPLEIRACLEALRGMAAGAAARAWCAALRTGRGRGAASAVLDPLLAAGLVANFHSGAAHLERRISRGNAHRQGSVQRLEALKLRASGAVAAPGAG
jgi:hypothetical protein